MCYCPKCAGGKEYLSELVDGLIKPYRFCDKCNQFCGWVKLHESNLVQKILKQNFDLYKRKVT